MPPQHEPPAHGTPSSVAVRRAVAVPAPGEDPGAGLGPRTPDSTAPVPIPSSPVPAPGRLRGWRARSAAAEGQEPASAERQQEEQQTRQRPESASAEPEREAGVGTLLAGNGDGANGADEAGPDAAPPGRPRGPMLAAAGIAGALLIAVPFLVLALTGDDEDRTVSTAPIGGTTLDPGMSDNDLRADYTAESPTPSASASASASTSPSASASAPAAKSAAPTTAKATPPPVTKKTVAPAATSVVQEGVKFTPSPRQLANAASNRSSVLLKNAATGQCIDIPGGGQGKVDGAVNQHPACSRTDNMLWDLAVADSDGGPGGASLFVVRSSTDGLCVNLPYNGTVKSGTLVREGLCNTTTADNQLWYLDPRPNSTYWIRNLVSNLCLSVRGGSSGGKNASISVTTCGDTATSAQRWSIS
ncbi:RICIN domain-containing protein [Streptomyces sp. GQFP]|uniref:RICIN domain-containing protein n=1 Tax=Streptomyces sp. GQFP TaxID=2907545 RepID=UPI001F33C6B6|nr:RICIN domain-containing protein [Streptomyces sp. GQFP]UIX32009.1 RICIN domain-containing protein [Streptomyces sp. GQFP]